MNTRLVLFSCVVLGACSGVPARSQLASLFDDAQYGPPPAEVRNVDVFAVSPAMHDYLNEHILPRAKTSGRNMALFDVLRDDLRLEYDAAITRTAAEAFDARAGNCLSLAILTGAFAKQLGIPVHYRLEYADPTWTRSEGVVFVNNHVNVALEHFRHYGLATGRLERGMIIDFVSQPGGTWYWDKVPERTIVAMYMNNRAAEAIAGGDARGAYWWARAAIRQAPDFADAYNTLGVFYRRQGDLARAERAISMALRYSPNSELLLTNMIGLLEQQNRPVEAKRIQAELDRNGKYRPFQFLDAGNRAMASGDPISAMALYRRELRHMPYSSELHFAIAVADAKLGNDDEARRQLALALQLSTRLSERDLYASKLEKLRALRVD